MHRSKLPIGKCDPCRYWREEKTHITPSPILHSDGTGKVCRRQELRRGERIPVWNTVVITFCKLTLEVEKTSQVKVLTLPYLNTILGGEVYPVIYLPWYKRIGISVK